MKTTDFPAVQDWMKELSQVTVGPSLCGPLLLGTALQQEVYSCIIL